MQIEFYYRCNKFQIYSSSSSEIIARIAKVRACLCRMAISTCPDLVIVEGSCHRAPCESLSFFRVAFEIALNSPFTLYNYTIPQFLMVALRNLLLQPYRTIVEYGIRRVTFLVSSSRTLLRIKRPFTVCNQYHRMASSPTNVSANKVSLDEFNQLLARYPSVLQRISDEKGGRLTP